MSPEEKEAFLAFCAEATTPLEYSQRVATAQVPFLAGHRAGRMPGDDGNAAAYVAMDRETKASC
jgi:hypothetical protein